MSAEGEPAAARAVLEHEPAAARAVLEQAFRAGLLDAAVAQRALGVLAQGLEPGARLAALGGAGVPPPVLERLAALGTLSGSARLRSPVASSPGASSPDARASGAQATRAGPLTSPGASTPIAGATSPGSRATGSRGVVNLPGAAPGAGHKLGPFTIEVELGRGGMGAVYKARGDDGALAAVKVMLSGGSATAGKRFEREANALRALSHENVVRFLGASSDPPPWIAMEFVAGRDLGKVLEDGALAFDEAAALVAQVARGVAHAHEHGIMHRDLKPQNVLVRASDGVALVTDFGLARELDASRHTKTGAMVGTLGYMSPEQLRGDRDVGKPTDVWALGAILYRCLTGEDPFTAPTAMELSKAIIDAPIVPPRKLVREVPADLESVALACLDRTAARRPTAAEVAAALTARRPLGVATQGGGARKLALALCTCGALGIALVVLRGRGDVAEAHPAAVPAGPQTTGPPPDAPAPVAPLPSAPVSLLEQARGEVARAGVAVLGPRPEEARRALDAALDLLGRAVELDPTDLAARLARGKLAERVGRTALARDDLERVLERTDGGPLAGEAAFVLGRIENYTDRTQLGALRPRIARAREQATGPWRELLAAFERLLDERAPEAMATLRPLIEAREAIAREEPAAALAIDWLEDRIRADLQRPDVRPIDRVLAGDPTDTWSWLRRSLTRFALGDARGSLDDAARGLALSPGQTDLRTRRYQALRILGREEEALAEARAVVAEYEQQEPKPLNDLAQALHHAALFCEALDRADEADALLDRIRDLNPPDIRPPLSRANRLVDAGEPEAALRMLAGFARDLPEGTPALYRVALSCLMTSVAIGSGQGAAWREEIVRSAPDALVPLAEYDLELGDVAACRAGCERILALAPGDENAPRLLLLAAVKAGPRERALAEVERYLPLARARSALSVAVAAAALGELGEHERAEALAREAIDAGAERAFVAWRALGAAQLARGDASAALDSLVRSVDLMQMDPEATTLLARAKLALGMVGAAELDAYGAATLAPYDRQALGVVLPLLVARGRHAEVLRMTRRLETMAKAGRPAPASARLAMAEAHLAKGQPAEAEALVRSVLAEDPSHVLARVLDAEVLLARGEKHRARAAVDEVLLAHPDEARARALRDRIGR